MNMPDPQALTAWMNQLTDPAAWQQWMKAALPAATPGGDGAIPGLQQMSTMFNELGARIDPAQLESIRADYLASVARLWQDFMSGQQPTLTDRRFASAEWRANPLAHWSAASYLLNARALTALGDAVQAPPREQMKIRFALQQMVDAMSPANFFATNPEAQQQMLDTKGESLTRGLANMLADLQKGRISQSDETAFEVGQNVGASAGQVVFENELIQLIQYAPLTPKVRATPLLMVPPCINKFYILDLQPDNSLVRYALEQGNTVFMISWRNPDASLGHISWDDYVGRGAIEALEAVSSITKQEKVHVFGFCVGGTVASTALAVLAARGQQRAASLTLLTTLLDFSDTGVLEVFVDEAQVALREQSLGSGGLMPGRDLASTFSALRPNDLVWNYVQQNYLKGKEPPAFDLLYWNADSTNLPGPMFCWYLRNTYLENRLRQPGALRVCGELVDLGAISAPVFVYGSRDDHIVPWQAAFASLALLNPAQPGANRFVLGASGHIAGVINPASKNKRSYWVNDGQGGLQANGAGSAEAWIDGAVEHKGSWWPEWAAFLAAHGGKEVAPPKRFGNTKYKPLEPAPGRYVKARA